MRRFFLKNSAGFTLIELIMVIILMGIIGAMASKMLTQGLNAYLTGKNVTDATWQGWLALESMIRDIHAVRSPNDISTATSSQLVFTDSNNSSISYSLSGTDLMRSSQILANGISSLTLSYFDKNGATTNTASLIRYIKITINITQGNTNLTLTTSVYPPNLN